LKEEDDEEEEEKENEPIEENLGRGRRTAVLDTKLRVRSLHRKFRKLLSRIVN